MSTVKLKGNTSGTGSVTLESPNLSSDITVTLPNATTTLGPGGLSAAFTVSASAEGNYGTGSITTTGGAGAYFIVGTIFGYNYGNPTITLGSTNVLDGYFDNQVWDNGTPSFTNGHSVSGWNVVSLSVSGIIYTSGNITISASGSGSKRISWGKIA